MNKFKIKPVTLLIAVFVLFALGFVLSPSFFSRNYEILSLVNTASEGVINKVLKEEPKVSHIKTPESVKAIYMTSCVVGTKSFRQDLVDMIDRTELNSLIIDIKDFTGNLSFPYDDPELRAALSQRCGANDIKTFIEELHKKNIYIIGRVTVFQDPYLIKLKPSLAVRRKSDGGIWQDKKGLSYVDPGAREAWDYIIKIATSSHAIGFDEINFDYVRFPSDGNLSDIAFSHSGNQSKAEVMETFFKYLHEKLLPSGVITSADLFGMTATNVTDMNIGQVLERTLPYFDYVVPMVYPSHYPAGFNGWKNPNMYPYEIIKFSMDRAVKRTVATSTVVQTLDGIKISSTTPVLYTKKSYPKEKLRTWIQDFDYGGDYGPKEVRAQIQATYDAGLSSWMMWAPSNRYTEAALE